MPVRKVTVTDDYTRADGSFPPGSVTFVPSVTSKSADGTITVNPVPAVLVNGEFSVQLFDNNDAGLSPSGWTYLVIETVDGWSRTRVISLPAAPVNTVALRDLTEVDPVTPGVPQVRSVNGIEPDAFGEITLPASQGSAPASRQILTTNGLTGGGDLTTDRTFQPVYGATSATVCEGDDPRLSDDRPPTAHSHPMDSVTGLPAALDSKEAVGTAATAVAGHAAAGDPHPQYLTASEGEATFADVEHDHVVGDVTGLQEELDNRAFRPTVVPRLVTTGNINLNTGSVGVPTAWQPLPGSPTLAIPAVAGDWIELAVNIGRQENASLLADVGVVVGGVIKRWLGAGTVIAPINTYEGDIGLYIDGDIPIRTAAFGFQVAAGDLDGSNVVFSILRRVLGAGSALLLADPNNPFQWCAKNCGSVIVL
jgi:hypothetical protein